MDNETPEVIVEPVVEAPAPKTKKAPKQPKLPENETLLISGIVLTTY